MKEIGGYIELDTYRLPMLHEGALQLNCGRNALAYLLRTRRIRKLYIPKLICASVTGVCEREGVPYVFYSIGPDLLPAQEITLEEDEWLYFVNYYSQFDNETISAYVRKYQRVIVDNAQSYFQPPLPGVDTLYSCRKYFGVADGAFLYTDVKPEEEYPVDESFERMHFLLGRYERTASEFYTEYSANNARFANEPIKQMSRLTQNLLHGIDYERVKAGREKNFAYLHRALKDRNKLTLNNDVGTFMYPLLWDKGAELKKKLREKKIYIPTLWPEVLDRYGENETAHDLAKNILPLPIDQRYGTEEMEACLKMLLPLI